MFLPYSTAPSFHLIGGTVTYHKGSTPVPCSALLPSPFNHSGCTNESSAEELKRLLTICGRHVSVLWVSFPDQNTVLRYRIHPHDHASELVLVLVLNTRALVDAGNAQKSLHGPPSHRVSAKPFLHDPEHQLEDLPRGLKSLAFPLLTLPPLQLP